MVLIVVRGHVPPTFEVAWATQVESMARDVPVPILTKSMSTHTFRTGHPRRGPATQGETHLRWFSTPSHLLTPHPLIPHLLTPHPLSPSPCTHAFSIPLVSASSISWPPLVAMAMSRATEMVGLLLLGEGVTCTLTSAVCRCPPRELSRVAAGCTMGVVMG